MAAEANDEDDEEARAFYLHTQPPGYGGYAPRASPLSWVFVPRLGGWFVILKI